MKRSFIATILVALALSAIAQVHFNHDGLKYTVLDENSVKVGKIDDNHKPKGKLVIPQQVVNDGKSYDVTDIASWGFFGCDDLTEISLPATLKKIDIWAFCKCENLKEIKIPSSVTEIGYAAFENCESFTSLTLPDGLPTVADRLVKECKNLKDVTLPQSVKVIESSAFSSCKSLESIVLPKSVESIGNYAFAYCENLNQIVMPEKLQSIGSEAFSSCMSLKSIALPEGVTTLSENAFNNCTALEQVTLPSSLASINGNPFSSCKALREYKVASESAYFTVKDGILYSKDMTKLIACPTKLAIGDFIVPASVTDIISHAFYDCAGLTSIKMTGVESIGESAFYGCRNLGSVNFGRKLKFLGKGAFYNNNLIKSVTFPDSFEHMEMNNFDFCSELRTVSVSKALSERERDFNNLSFNFNSNELRFVVRLPKGKTKTLTFDEIPDVKKYFINR